MFSVFFWQRVPEDVVSSLYIFGSVLCETVDQAHYQCNFHEEYSLLYLKGLMESWQMFVTSLGKIFLDGFQKQSLIFFFFFFHTDTLESAHEKKGHYTVTSRSWLDERLKKFCIFLQTLLLISQSSVFFNLFFQFLVPFPSWERWEGYHKKFWRNTQWTRRVELKMKDKEKTDPFDNPITAPVTVLWKLEWKDAKQNPYVLS